jgi:hypothetical protein
MPFHHYYSSLSQIIQGQNLTKSCIHTEKLTLGGTLIFHILFEGKEETPEIDNSKNNDRTSNFLFEGIHQIQSSPPCLHLREYNITKKASTTSTSQSCIARKKKGKFH